MIWNLTNEVHLTLTEWKSIPHIYPMCTKVGRQSKDQSRTKKKSLKKKLFAITQKKTVKKITAKKTVKKITQKKTEKGADATPLSDTIRYRVPNCT